MSFHDDARIDEARDEAWALLTEFAQDVALSFARAAEEFDVRFGEEPKVCEMDGLAVLIETPAACGWVEVEQRPGGELFVNASANLMYTHRVGLLTAPTADDSLAPTIVDAEMLAEALSVQHGGKAFAAWPIGRDAYHPDLIAFEGHIYRRKGVK